MMQYNYHKYFIMSMPFSHITLINKMGMHVRNNILSPNNFSVTIKRETLHDKKMKWVSNYFIFRGDWINTLHANHELHKNFRKKCYIRYRQSEFKDLYFLDHLQHNHILSVVPTKKKNS